jgi:hypothetical protein
LEGEQDADRLVVQGRLSHNWVETLRSDPSIRFGISVFTPGGDPASVPNLPYRFDSQTQSLLPDDQPLDPHTLPLSNCLFIVYSPYLEGLTSDELPIDTHAPQDYKVAHAWVAVSHLALVNVPLNFHHILGSFEVVVWKGLTTASFDAVESIRVVDADCLDASYSLTRMTFSRNGLKDLYLYKQEAAQDHVTFAAPLVTPVSLEGKLLLIDTDDGTLFRITLGSDKVILSNRLLRYNLTLSDYKV